MNDFSKEQVGMLVVMEYDARELYLSSAKAKLDYSDYIKEDLLERMDNVKLSIEEFIYSIELQEKK